MLGDWESEKGLCTILEDFAVAYEELNNNFEAMIGLMPATDVYEYSLSRRTRTRSPGPGSPAILGFPLVSSVFFGLPVDLI